MSRGVPNQLKGSTLYALLPVAIAVLLLGAPRPGLGDEEPDFLVAKPTISDPLFEESVILMVPPQAVSLVDGVIINKPTAIPVKRVFPNSVDLDGASGAVYFGGPVEPEAALMVRSTQTPAKGERHVFADLYMTVDPRQIAQILRDPHLDKAKVRVFLGYSQWGQDQLRAEKMEGSWYEVPAHPELVFTQTPKTLWNKLVDRARFIRVNASSDAFGVLTGVFDLPPSPPQQGTER